MPVYFIHSIRLMKVNKEKGRNIPSPYQCMPSSALVRRRHTVCGPGYTILN